ncbi:TPA: DUF3265 domain-containing protein [Vibrio parahaemolyticus]|nr:DUF3265 domain-containing protein [Vibrio parahaemolyticus]
MSCALTKCSRGIRNAWHFYYALNLVIKVVAATSVLRCSPLNMALVYQSDLHPNLKCRVKN